MFKTRSEFLQAAINNYIAQNLDENKPIKFQADISDWDDNAHLEEMYFDEVLKEWTVLSRMGDSWLLNEMPLQKQCEILDHIIFFPIAKSATEFLESKKNKND